jgi:hypothetical protein
MFPGMSAHGALPEIVERPDHPRFVGMQFHPELKSRPFDPHPPFLRSARRAPLRRAAEQRGVDGALKIHLLSTHDPGTCPARWRAVLARLKRIVAGGACPYLLPKRFVWEPEPPKRSGSGV